MMKLQNVTRIWKQIENAFQFKGCPIEDMSSRRIYNSGADIISH